MKKTFIVFVFAFLFTPCIIPAQDNGPEEYVIQQNDTLWGIANTKLADPFLWPKLWNVNPHINNPDLIFPGEKIIIPSREKLTRQETAPEEKKVPSTKKTKAVTTETAPAVSVLEAEKEKKYLIDKNTYNFIGWISDDFPAIGKIIATPSGKKLAGKDDIVYITVSKEYSNNKFFAIKDVKMVKHPVTGKKLGHLIRVTGILEITGKDNNTLKTKIIRSSEDVQVSDGLISYREMDPPLVPDKIRYPKVEGHIVESLFAKEISAEGDFVFLDKGLNDGLLAGDTFSVFSGSTIGRVIGKIQIISLQPTTSSAVILNSEEEISIGNRVGQK